MSVKLRDYQYSLPDELIARYPTRQRSASRLLLVDSARQSCSHEQFKQLPALLRAGDLLVFNDTRVIPARLFGRKRGSGGRVEILVERVLSEQSLLAQCRASKAPRDGTVIEVGQPGDSPRAEFTVTGRHDGFFQLSLSRGDVSSVLDAVGHMPLPPYIDRRDEAVDRERYQTVYAARPGAVAAPTAGLHFDEALLSALQDAGVASVRVTLHVGAGTFQPVRCEDVREHRMHAEWIDVDDALCSAVADAWACGGRIVAVGTTSARCLESAAAGGTLQPYRGDTRIFIHPPYDFRVVDGLITNFHLPESTLLMLVAALAGRETILAAYAAAIKERYRFFSYGDAMLIWGQQRAAQFRERC